jgi:hypothetical protein
MKIGKIMCRQPILMAVAFIGFIILVANLPIADCAENGNSNSYPNYDGQRTNANFAYLGAIPQNNTPLNAQASPFNHSPQFQVNKIFNRI